MLNLFRVCVAAVVLTGVGEAADNLPAFLAKVQLHNFDGYELTPDGAGVSLYRVPADLLGSLSDAGAKQMTHARCSEIRFVVEDGATLEDVTIHFKSNRNTTVMFYRGDELCGRIGLSEKKGEEPYIPPSLVGKTSSPGARDKACEIALKPSRLKRPAAKPAEMPAGPQPARRFPEQVCRVLLDSGVITLTGIEGDIRPPRPEELPPVMVSYGTSISQGAAATAPDRSFTSLTAAALGYGLRNLGCSGSAFCEPEISEYLAQQSGDLFLFEISVNMAGKGFSVEEFRSRAASLVDQVAEAHPRAAVVCISILTLGKVDRSESPAGPVPEYRKALEEICRTTKRANVHFIDGRQLLSLSGLAKDQIHPTDEGMAEIASKLVPRLQAILKRN